MNEILRFLQSLAKRVSGLVGNDLQSQIRAAVSRFSRSAESGRGLRSSSPLRSLPARNFVERAASLFSRPRGQSPIRWIQRRYAEWQVKRAKVRFERSKRSLTLVRREAKQTHRPRHKKAADPILSSRSRYRRDAQPMSVADSLRNLGRSLVGVRPTGKNAEAGVLGALRNVFQSFVRTVVPQRGNRPTNNPSASPIIGWFDAVNSWLTSHSKRWNENRVRRIHDHNKDVLDRAKANLKNIEQADASRKREQTAEKAQRKQVRQEKERQTSTMSPEALVKQLISSQKKRDSMRFQWQRFKTSFFGRKGRAQALAVKAARRYQFAAGRATRARAILAAAKGRFNAAPGPGQAGYNPRLISSLYRQVQISQGHVAATEARAAKAFATAGRAATTAAEAGGLRAMAGALTGAATKLAGAAGTALMVLSIPNTVEAASEQFNERYRHFGPLSSKLGGAYNNFDLMTQSINHRYAEGISESTQLFQDQLNRFRNNILPAQTFATNLLNGAGAAGLWLANLPSNAAREATIAAAAASKGILNPFSKEYQDYRTQMWEEMEKEYQDNAKKGPDQFSGVFKGFAALAEQKQSSAYKDKKEYRFNNRPKDMLPPMK